MSNRQVQARRPIGWHDEWPFVRRDGAIGDDGLLQLEVFDPLEMNTEDVDDRGSDGDRVAIEIDRNVLSSEEGGVVELAYLEVGC